MLGRFGPMLGLLLDGASKPAGTAREAAQRAAAPLPTTTDPAAVTAYATQLIETANAPRKALLSIQDPAVRMAVASEIVRSYPDRLSPRHFDWDIASAETGQRYNDLLNLHMHRWDEQLSRSERTDLLFLQYRPPAADGRPDKTQLKGALNQALFDHERFRDGAKVTSVAPRKGHSDQVRVFIHTPGALEEGHNGHIDLQWRATPDGLGRWNLAGGWMDDGTALP